MNHWQYQNEQGNWIACSVWLAVQMVTNHNPDRGWEFAPVKLGDAQ